MPARQLRHPERAEHVHLELLAQRRQRQLLHRTALGDPSGVDQDVDVRSALDYLDESDSSVTSNRTGRHLIAASASTAAGSRTRRGRSRRRPGTVARPHVRRPPLAPVTSTVSVMYPPASAYPSSASRA